MLQLGMSGEDRGEAIPLLVHQFHQALECGEGFARQGVRLIDEEGNGLAAFADEIQELRQHHSGFEPAEQLLEAIGVTQDKLVEQLENLSSHFSAAARLTLWMQSRQASQAAAASQEKAPEKLTTSAEAASNS